MSRIYHTTQYSSIKLGLAAAKSVLVNGVPYEPPGLVIELVESWPAGEGARQDFTNPVSRKTEVTHPPTSAGPGFIDIDNPTPSTRNSVELFEGSPFGTPELSFKGLSFEDKMDKLEEYITSPHGVRTYGFQEGDVRSQRKVSVTMTTGEFAEFKKDKKLASAGGSAVSGAQKVTRGTRTLSDKQ